MRERVTIQDIADALGLSRNTVSKAINNTGNIAEETRDLILRQAAQMGYKQFSYIDLEAGKLRTGPNSLAGREYAILMAAYVDNSHFAATMIDRIQRVLSEFGASLTIYRIMPAELEQCQLPVSLDPERISGIFCTEMFYLPYVRMLTALPVPVVFIDSPLVYGEEPLGADVVLMDNTTYTYDLLRIMKERGIKRIGFAGPTRHCRSFYERYLAFDQAMAFHGLAYDPEYCIYLEEEEHLIPRDEEFKKLREFLKTKVGEMKEAGKLPELFICANDFMALDLREACMNAGVRIPEDVMLCGYDDSPESRIVTPSFTTVHIHSQSMGITAVELMMSRKRDPDQYYRVVHTEADLILRGSTGD